jgi:uncharacterized coiled-coil protein SlyX
MSVPQITDNSIVLENKIRVLEEKTTLQEVTINALRENLAVLASECETLKKRATSTDKQIEVIYTSLNMLSIENEKINNWITPTTKRINSDAKFNADFYCRFEQARQARQVHEEDQSEMLLKTNEMEERIAQLEIYIEKLAVK